VSSAPLDSYLLPVRLILSAPSVAQTTILDTSLYNYTSLPSKHFIVHYAKFIPFEDGDNKFLKNVKIN
jgi:hypothetical protein